MQEADKVLYSEFRGMMAGRKALSKPVALKELPSQLRKTGFDTNLRSVTAKGIKEPYFSVLNGKVMHVMGRTRLQKRRYLANGEFQKDAKGNIITDDVPVPNGSLAVITTENIKLPNLVDGKKHTPTKGFAYVDYKRAQGSKLTYYIYIIPREYLYELNLCSLSLSYNRKRNFYKGAKISLQNGTFVYLYVSPYKGRLAEDSRILSLKNGVDFDKEVEALINGWQTLGVMFNTRLTALEDHINGNRNLGIVLLNPTLNAEDYVPVTKTSLELGVEDDSDSLDLY